jgi:hypothetical protein
MILVPQGIFEQDVGLLQKVARRLRSHLFSAFFFFASLLFLLIFQ